MHTTPSLPVPCHPSLVSPAMFDHSLASLSSLSPSKSLSALLRPTELNSRVYTAADVQRSVESKSRSPSRVFLLIASWTCLPRMFRFESCSPGIPIVLFFFLWTSALPCFEPVERVWRRRAEVGSRPCCRALLLLPLFFLSPVPLLATRHALEVVRARRRASPRPGCERFLAFVSSSHIDFLHLSRSPSLSTGRVTMSSSQNAATASVSSSPVVLPPFADLSVSQQ